MKTIIKRGLGEEDYRGEKIEKAMEKAFLSEGITVEEEKLHFLLGKVEEALEDKFRVSVEEIQNAVEEALMQNGDYRVARAYILYREKRTLLRHLRQRIKEEIGEEGIEEVLKKIQKDFPDYDLSRLSAKYLSLSKGEQEIPKRLALLTRAAAELTTQEEPNWEKIAGRLLSYHFHKELRRTEESRALHGFYEKLCYLTEQGLYGSYILEAYTKEEVEELAKVIDEGRNDLLLRTGLTSFPLCHSRQTAYRARVSAGDVPRYCHAPCNEGGKEPCLLCQGILRHYELASGNHGDADTVQCQKALPPAKLLLY